MAEADKKRDDNGWDINRYLHDRSDVVGAESHGAVFATRREVRHLLIVDEVRSVCS